MVLQRAPWWGGVFERMVRMTKRCLKKIVGRAKLTYDELIIAVIEVEAVINSRPLSSDDLEEPALQHTSSMDAGCSLYLMLSTVRMLRKMTLW